MIDRIANLVIYLIKCFRAERICVRCIRAIGLKKVIWIYRFGLPLYFVAKIQEVGKK